MTPAIATLIGAGIVIVINLLTAAYVYGKLTAAVAGVVEDVRRLDREQGEQWNDINQFGRSIEKIKGKIGMNGI